MKKVRGNSIFLAFNKAIADELKAKGVNARTFHSLVFSPVMRAKNAQNPTMDKLRKLCRENMSRDEMILYGPFAQKRSEEHTSELQSLMRISYAVFCLEKKTTRKHTSKM